MNERVGVDAFDGAGRGQCACRSGSASLGGGEAECGAEALAACEDAVAHGAMEGGGAGFFGRQPTVQCGVGFFPEGVEFSLQLHGRAES